MAQFLNPYSGRQFADANGNPYNGAKLFVYIAGSSTKATVTKDSAGTSNHTNPIVLNTRGEPADASGASQAMWQSGGQAVKLVLAPANDTDPPASPISTWDNLAGINDTSISVDQWAAGPAPTYIGATSFTLVGDQTSTFHIGRRIRTVNSGGTVYSTITNSVFTSLTTVTVENDSGTLDAGLSSVFYSILSATNHSIPTGATYKFKGNNTHEGTNNFQNTMTMTGAAINHAALVDVASATTTNIGAAASNSVRITGTTTITALDTVAAGIMRHVTFADALILTHNATSLILPGALSITTAANDNAVFRSEGSGNWRCLTYTKANGYPVTKDNVQTFLVNGTWNKPSGLPSSALVIIEAWGGGGGGSNVGDGGGGGGAYIRKVLPLSSLGTTETVTIGAGGAVNTNGGNTTFGSLVTAYGGGGASNSSGVPGGGGSEFYAGTNGSGGSPPAQINKMWNGGNGVAGGVPGDTHKGIYGGGGGAGDITNIGGVSINGGNGGTYNGSVAAKVPGGGGAIRYAGANGKCVVTVLAQ